MRRWGGPLGKGLMVGAGGKGRSVEQRRGLYRGINWGEDSGRVHVVRMTSRNPGGRGLRVGIAWANLKQGPKLERAEAGMALGKTWMGNCKPGNSSSLETGGGKDV